MKPHINAVLAILLFFSMSSTAHAEQDINVNDPLEIVGLSYETTYTEPARWHLPLSDDLQDHIIAETQRINFDLEVFLGLIEQESYFDNSVIGGAGEVGLCQIHPAHFETMYSMNLDPYNEFDNVTYAIILLEDLTANNDLKTALAKYNRGKYASDLTKGFIYANSVLNKSSKYERSEHVANTFSYE